MSDDATGVGRTAGNRASSDSDPSETLEVEVIPAVCPTGRVGVLCCVYFFLACILFFQQSCGRSRGRASVFRTLCTCTLLDPRQREGSNLEAGTTHCAGR